MEEEAKEGARRGEASGERSGGAAERERESETRRGYKSCLLAGQKKKRGVARERGEEV